MVATVCVLLEFEAGIITLAYVNIMKFFWKLETAAPLWLETVLMVVELYMSSQTKTMSEKRHKKTNHKHEGESVMQLLVTKWWLKCLNAGRGFFFCTMVLFFGISVFSKNWRSLLDEKWNYNQVLLLLDFTSGITSSNSNWIYGTLGGSQNKLKRMHDF